MASNLYPAGFDSIMSKTLATATLDRLLHYAHVVVTGGPSHRLADATAGKGGDASGVSVEREQRGPPTRNSGVYGPRVLLSVYREVALPLDTRISATPSALGTRS